MYEEAFHEVNKYLSDIKDVTEQYYASKTLDGKKIVTEKVDNLLSYMCNVFPNPENTKEEQNEILEFFGSGLCIDNISIEDSATIYPVLVMRVVLCNIRAPYELINGEMFAKFSNRYQDVLLNCT